LPPNRKIKNKLRNFGLKEITKVKKKSDFRPSKWWRAGIL
jgi:hypothetical protein